MDNETRARITDKLIKKDKEKSVHIKLIWAIPVNYFPIKSIKEFKNSFYCGWIYKSPYISEWIIMFFGIGISASFFGNWEFNKENDKNDSN